MSAAVDQYADAAAGAAPALPVRKRKKPDDDMPTAPGMTPDLDMKMVQTDLPPTTAAGTPPATSSPPPATAEEDTKRQKRGPVSKAREVRLEQNRKAARESRRRKKVMIEELQRSVIFFSRANGTLKQQNDELARLLMQAQAQVSALENGQQQPQQVVQQQVVQPQQQAMKQEQTAQQTQEHTPTPAPAVIKTEDTQQNVGFQQAQAQAVATQAIYESQGFPAAAARAAARTMNGGSSNPPAAAPVATPTPAPAQAQQLPAMQPGATMQAMANFQQAAAAAMNAAMQGMQGSIPGITMNTLAAPPAGANPQQAYTDTMTALAMQAAAGQQFAMFQPGASFLPHPMMAWQNVAQQQQQHQQAQAAAAPANSSQPQQQTNA